MNIYIIPALFALLIKLVILVSAYRSIKGSQAFFNIVAVFALHNICEVLAFLKFGGANFGYVLISYYVTSIWALAVVFFYAIDISHYKNSILNGTVIAVTAALTLALMFSGLIVNGTQSIDYTITAVRGPFYWAFQLYALTMFVLLLVTLVFGYRRAKDHAVEIQCLTVLFALAPLLLLGCGTMLAMNLGYKVTAAIILPLATTAFLFITLLSESKHRLTDIRRFLPWSPERKTSNEIMDIFTAYSRDAVEYRQAVSQIEKLLVLHKYQKNGENASATAELMGMPRSSLYSIFNRLEIESKGSK